MKKLLFFPLLMGASLLYAQDRHNQTKNPRVVLDNEQVQVVAFDCPPNGTNVCGAGMHHHKPHLTIALTDASVWITTPDGDRQKAEIPAGAAIWFDAGTHRVVNAGTGETKLLLVYLKESK